MKPCPYVILDGVKRGRGSTGLFYAGFRRTFRSAFPLVNYFAGFASRIFGQELLSTAVAGVHEPSFGKVLQDSLVDFAAVALDAFAIVGKTEPGEVFADAVDVFLAGATLVVVFDAQVNP